MEKVMRFYTLDGLIARVGEALSEKKVPMWNIFIGTEEIAESKQELTRIRAEQTLVETAKVERWIPCAIKDALDDPKKPGLQGEGFNITAYVKLPSTDVVEKKTQYVIADVEIQHLDAEFEADQKEAKADHKKEIADLEAVKMRLERGALQGEESVELEVSWERDAENELMFMVDRETGAFRAVRDMLPDEKNPVLFDGPKDDGTFAPDEEILPQTPEEQFEEDQSGDPVEELSPDTE